MASDIVDRLGLLRESCVSKYDRLEEIEKQLKEGQIIIDETKKTFPLQSEICRMRVLLAEKQSNHALIVEEINADIRKQQDLREKTYVLSNDLEGHKERYKQLAGIVALERQLLHNHFDISMDNLNMLYEQYLMSSEENNTLAALMKDVEQKSRTTNHTEWLKKIIRATQIQLKEDESCLAHLEKEHTLLTKNPASSNNRK